MENGCSGMPGGALRKRWAALLIGVASCWLQGCGSRQAVESASWPDVSLTAGDRLLILAPHPDDEVLACGGILQQAVAQKLPLRVVFLTYGDNNEWSFLLYRKLPVFTPGGVRQMGLVRHDEAMVAAKILGLSPDDLIFLGYPDFGTLRMWERHWGQRPPFKSMLTRATAVPYANALRPGAPYKGEEVLRDLEAILREFRPTKVFVSHAGDRMPDHRALYLFTRVALWDVEPDLHPALYPYLTHFTRWPRPRGYRPQTPLDPPAAFQQGMAWHSHPLSQAEVVRKHNAILAHRSQYNYSASYLLSFIRPNELFGDFPSVVLHRDTPEVALSTGNPTEAAETPEELTERERAAFVGIETRSVQVIGDELVLSIGFSRPLGETVEGSIYLFGYRADQPFAQMPKLHVKFGAIRHAAYDQTRALPKGTVQLTRRLRSLTLRVPLEVLGAPERILTSAQTYLGELPLDRVSWRVLEIGSNHSPSPAARMLRAAGPQGA